MALPATAGLSANCFALTARELQESLRPILLRRMKEDVEKLPEKEEVGFSLNTPGAGRRLACLMMKLTRCRHEELALQS